MADQDDNAQGARAGGSAGGAGGSAGGRSGSGRPGAGSGSNRNTNRNKNRRRNRGRGRSGSGGGSGAATRAGSAGTQKQTQGNGRRSSGQRARTGGGARSRGAAGGGNGRATSPSGGDQRSTRPTVALAPSPLPERVHVEPSLGAPQVYPGEVAANRRRVVRLCAYTAAVPALLLGLALGLAVSIVAGVVAFVAVAAAVGYSVWRFAPSFALRRIDAVPVNEHDNPRFANITEGLCATFGLSMPSLHVLEDDVPNACALGRDARRADIVVTSGLLRRVDPIELEGVLAHELAHVKRGDNGVSSVGIMLATLVGGEGMLRRCVGESREYRADVVGASTVRYPRGLLGALRTAMDAPPPGPGSIFATPARFGPTRWVWIDPSVGHRDDPVEPGDLDATSVRTTALSEW